MKAELKAFALVVIVTILLVNIYAHLFITNKEEITNDYAVVENIEEEKEEPAPEPEPETVYDGMTLEELSDKINRSLNSTISGQGNLIASYSLEMGVDPYIATAIILHETGCKWGCSYLVNACNNVGGQKGSGCGEYSYFDSLESGIKAFVDNLYYNYVSYGLLTPEEMNTKYASSPTWAANVNKYIESIKAQ